MSCDSAKVGGAAGDGSSDLNLSSNMSWASWNIDKTVPAFNDRDPFDLSCCRSRLGVNAALNSTSSGGKAPHLFRRSKRDGLLPEGLQGHVELTLEDHLHVVFQDKRLDRHTHDTKSVSHFGTLWVLRKLVLPSK